MEGPVRWWVRAASGLPDAFQPGAFAAVLITVTWVLVAHRRALWAFACRIVAVVADLIIGLLLLPEYVVTSARRRRGYIPGVATRVVGDVLERCLDAAAGLYRHGSSPARVSTTSGGNDGGGPELAASGWAYPVRLVGVVAVTPIVAWLILDHAPDSAVATWIREGWVYWSDLVAWAS